ncbi:MAG TPA: signal recognition particle-docking protein FtsY [Nitrososphaeraceae archaeon]|nr:signal recognition particle-docking protein FtsY [Nitrososphaeraceae archaeon]
MFDKLRKAFSSAAKTIGQKELSEKDLDDNLFDLQLALLESDVAQEVIDDLSARLKKELLGLKLERGQVAEDIIRSKLHNAIGEMLARCGQIDLIEKIKAKRETKGGPFVIVFLGINGTGKTTTVAKISNLLRKNGISVVLAAGDTHRAGAIEQLSEHAKKLSLKIIMQRYGSDPSAVARDAVDHSRKHHVDAVLIDTAGRMQTAKNLMDEISKIVRVSKPDLKLFIGDSLAGNDTINQAREFFHYTNFDGAILTKTDADSKGGAALSIAYITSKPIVYLGVGQGYEDIIPFNPAKFLESIFGNTSIIDVENLRTSTFTDAPATSESIREISPLSSRIDSEVTTIPNMINETETPLPISVPEMQTKEIKEEEKEEGMPFDKNSVEESIIQSIPSSSSYSPPAVKEEEEEEKEKKPSKKEEKKMTSRFSRLFGRKDKTKGKITEKSDEE